MGRRAVELGPSDADGLLFLGVALFEDGKPAEALVHAERAVDLNPMRPSYYCFYYGMVLWANERHQEAVEVFEECLRKAPNFGSADTYRVIALVGLGRVDEAKAELARFMARPGGRHRHPATGAGACWPRHGGVAGSRLATHPRR